MGMNTVKGIIPAPIRNPVQAVVEAKNNIEQIKADKEEADELAAMFAYNGDKPKGGD